MKYKIFIITLIVIVGVPTIALGSSLTVSLIQGKTPSEAVQVLTQQIDSLFGRIDNLETKQAETDKDITAAQLEIEYLKLENENLKLKTDTVLSDTEDIRVKNTRQNQCAELSTQITARINIIRAPYLERLKPIQEEYQNLKVSINKASSSEEASALKKSADEKQKEIDAINLELEQVLQNDSELQSLTEQANKLLCA